MQLNLIRCHSQENTQTLLALILSVTNSSASQSYGYLTTSGMPPPPLTLQQQVFQHCVYSLPLTMCTIQPIKDILVRHFIVLHFPVLHFSVTPSSGDLTYYCLQLGQREIGLRHVHACVTMT